MQTNPYKLSFTAAGLSLSASLKIAEVYLQLRDWEAVRGKTLADNLLQARTQSSLQRTFQELVPRLQQLSEEQLALLVEGSHQEQRQLLWVAVCRQYAYIQDFAVEVLREKYLSLDFELTGLDYDAFFYKKAEWHDELDQLAASTKTKLRTVLFRMLREAGLLSKDNLIIPVILSGRLIEVLRPAAPTVFQIFPMPLAAVSG